MAEILIRRHQELAAIPLCLVEQCAIAKIRPPSREGGIHHVFGKLPAWRHRHNLIEQYFQVSYRVLQVPGLMVQNTFSLPAFNTGEPLQKLFNRGTVPEVFLTAPQRTLVYHKKPRLR